MEISKTALVATVIICIFLGLVGYELLMNMQGGKLEKAHVQPDSGLKLERGELPAKIQVDSKIQLDSKTQVDVQTQVDSDEVPTVAEMSTSASEPLYLPVPDHQTPVSEERADIFNPDHLDVTEAQLRRLATVMSLKTQYIQSNTLLSASDVLFEGAEDDQSSRRPLVLDQFEYQAINNFFENPDTPEGKKTRQLAECVYQIHREEQAVITHVSNEILPTALPDNTEIEKFFSQFILKFARFDQRYINRTEHLKEAVRIYLTREKLTGYFLRTFREFAQSGRIKLNWPEASPPWMLPMDHTIDSSINIHMVKPVFGDGPSELHEDTTVGDTTVGDTTVGDATVGDATVGDATVGDTTAQNTTATHAGTGAFKIGESLFTLDNQIMPAEIANLSLVSLEIPLMSLGHEETFIDILKRMVPPEEGTGNNLYSWLQNFAPDDREQVVKTLFATLAQARIKDSRPVFGTSGDYIDDNLKLSSIISVISYVAFKSRKHNMWLGYDIIDKAPVITQILMEGCFSAQVTFPENLISASAWLLLSPYTAGGKKLNIFPSNPLKYLDIPANPGALKMFARKEVLKFGEIGAQMSMSDLGGQPLTIDQENPVRYLVDRRFGRTYPLASWEGLIRPKQVSLLGDPIDKDSASWPTLTEHGSQEELPASTDVSHKPTEQLKHLYEKNYGHFNIGSGYRFSILFHTDREVVKTARKKIREGMSFGDAVFMHSLIFPEGLEAKLFPGEVLKSEVAVTLESLKIGEVSQIFEIGQPANGFAMVYLLEKTEPSVLPFENEQVRELLQTYYYAYFIQEVAKEQLSRGGGYSTKYSRWIWPADSDEIKNMLNRASSLLGYSKTEL